MTLSVENTPSYPAPYDCLSLIVEFIDDHRTLSNTCKKFKEIIRSEKMQEFLLKRDYGFSIPSPIDSFTSAPSQYLRRLSSVFSWQTGGFLAHSDPLFTTPTHCHCIVNMKAIPSTVVTMAPDRHAIFIKNLSSRHSKGVETDFLIEDFQMTPDKTKVLIKSENELHLLDLKTRSFIWHIHRDSVALTGLTGCSDTEVFIYSQKEGRFQWEILNLQTAEVKSTKIPVDNDTEFTIFHSTKNLVLGQYEDKLGVYNYYTDTFDIKCFIGEITILHAQITPDGT